jgi:hypothetical protein
MLGSRLEGVMTELPSGTVTLLFSDIEGSTRLLERLGDRYAKKPVSSGSSLTYRPYRLKTLFLSIVPYAIILVARRDRHGTTDWKYADHQPCCF